ncbi:MAG: hypothetical protein WBC78_10935 [Candidatus Sulfotelmatobacter sp.]
MILAGGTGSDGTFPILTGKPGTDGTEEEGKMPWDKWRVSKVKDSDPEEFILTFLDTALEHAKPFMHTSDPMSESELREELGNEGISNDDTDAAIQTARADAAEAA